MAVAGIAFGLVTLAAGGSVLAGRDPGYAVFMPLLAFNVTMGFAYVAAGIAGWRAAAGGRRAAALVFLANAVVLAAIVYFYANGSAVAVESLRAMSFRTVAWLALYLGFRWLA